MKNFVKIIFCLLISFQGLGQAPTIKKTHETTDSILKVYDQYGNLRYSISPDRLAKFYVATRNLDLLGVKLKELRYSYDTLTIKNAKIESEYKAREKFLLNMQRLTQEQLDSCKTTVYSVDEDNGRLLATMERVKKNRKYYYFAGVATPIVVTIVVVVVKNSLIK